MTPTCYNRAPFVDPMAGWRQVGLRVQRNGYDSGFPVFTERPVLRYRWPWFEDRCATHDGTGIGPNGENYPKAHGWVCDGCRWDPRP